MDAPRSDYDDAKRTRSCLAAASGAAILVSLPTDGRVLARVQAVVPALTSHVLPIYPPIARSAHIQERVLVNVTIGSNGRVAHARLLRSIPLLDQAALDAIWQWRFMALPEKSTQVTVTVRFVLNDPFVYPRPATYRHDLPSWIPGNFAFVYKYECRAATVEIDSITRLVTNTKDRRTPVGQFSFDFEREQAADVFVTLVGTGFFEAVRAGDRTWREVPPVEAGIRQTGSQILVTVTAQRPHDEVSMPQIQWFGGDRPARSFHHVLRVRRIDHWKEFSWYEPLDAIRSESEKALAASGLRIRALVEEHLSDVRTRPACL